MTDRETLIREMSRLGRQLCGDWSGAITTDLEVTADGADVRVAAEAFRLTMTPARARRLAAELLGRADDAERAAGTSNAEAGSAGSSGRSSNAS